MVFNKSSIVRTGFIFVTLGLMVTSPGCKTHLPAEPILILASDDGFGAYTGEILRAEGFNEFQIKSVFDEDITALSLLKYDVVILAQREIGAAKGEIIKNFVHSGGNLIAFRPDIILAEIFGISPMQGIVDEGYIGIDTSLKEGSGLSSESLQFHGKADIYSKISGREIASLYSDAYTKTGYPAVVAFTYGKGNSYIFTYNLPESIVYTRQGNPGYAGKEKDGINGLRAMDLFTDGWLDHSKNYLNQADIQMNLLSHCIENLAENRRPLPRLWYFPDTLKCLVTLTNDGEYRSEADFELQFSDIDSAGAKMTIYILETDKVSKEWVDKWTGKGFEISGHPDDVKEAGDPRWSEMNNVLALKRTEITDLFGLEMRTIVNHWFLWCGKDSLGNPEFAAQAMIEAQNGLELDINYAHYDNGSNQEHFLGSQGPIQGNFTGSGLIMKFAGSRGEVLDIYQHLNNVYDQQYNENHDPEGFYDCFKGLMDRSINDEAYSFISIKSHNDEYYFSKAPLMKMISYSKKNGIPVWTASMLLGFIKMRNEARFSDIEWRGSCLSFSVESASDLSSGLTVMIPYLYGKEKIEEINLNGKASEHSQLTVRGNQYAFLTVKPNLKHSITVKYN